MNTQPQALVLADAIEKGNYFHEDVMYAAAELRRLHEENTALRQAIEEADKQTHTDHPARHWDRTCPACVAEAEKQEPIAWADQYYVDRKGHDFWVSRQKTAKDATPLYLAPPKREWVGLTHEEIRDAYEQCMPEDVLFARAIEDKLREKNT